MATQAQDLSVNRVSNCRLCGGRLTEQFRANVLDRHEVAYLRCDVCGSLETEEPYWLDEAYTRGSAQIEADSGAALRNLDSFAIVYWIARILGIVRGATILDFGGGTGLLCRLLRDIGFNARLYDAHSQNCFAKGFVDTGGKVDVVCSFEVFEHFASPKEQAREVLERAGQLCIIGTATYEDQGSEWWYLNASAGQHVFFYSEEAMRILGRLNAFHYTRVGNIHVFSKEPIGAFKRRAMRFALGSKWWPVCRAFSTLTLNYRRAAADSNAMTKSRDGNRTSSAALSSGDRI